MYDPEPVRVYGLPETLDSVRAHLMDADFHPDLTQRLNDAPARYDFLPVRPLEAFDLLGEYEVTPIPASHPAPSVGYIVRNADGSAIAYTGDTGGSVRPFFEGDPLDVLFVDTTFPDRLSWRAEVSGHLTPLMLGDRIAEARDAGLPLPRIVPVHVGLQHRREIADALAREGARLGIDLGPGHEDMVVEQA